jgi:hypothetical protein
MDQHEGASWLYEEAIKVGFDPPEVYANLAYTLVHQKPARSEVMVQEKLRKALERYPNLQAVRHTRILLNLPKARTDPNVFPELLADVDQALQGPESADLYRDAACAYGLAAARDPNPQVVERALYFVRKSVELGKDPKYLRFDPHFEPLKENQEFQELVNRPSPKQPPPPALRVVDPVKDAE